MALAASERASPRARRRAYGALIACAALALLVGGVAAVWSKTPPVGDMGARLAVRLHAARAHAVPLTAIAPTLPEAVVATEDEHFYQHAGVDVLGLLRAIPYDLSHGTTAQGGSTITEQLVKQLYLDGNDHTLVRKLEDMVLALKLEQRYSKRQILSAYLNTAYFGSNAYGIAGASQRYFGEAPARLDVARASLLAGLIQAPSAFDPLHHPHAARVRQVEVLRSLVRNNMISVAAGERALGEPLRLTSGQVLAPIGVPVKLAPGPAFDWRELGLGLLLFLFAAAALFVGRRRGLRSLPVGAASVFLALFGLWALIRSFRAA